MNSHLKLRPDLRDCVLEERTLPAITNFGTVILTTSGLILITPFPGANNSASGSLGSTSGPGGGTAASVSGVPVPTYLFITGSYGISSLRPGNITGVPILAMSASGGAAGSLLRIEVGSGADSAGGPTNVISKGGATNNVVGNTTYADPTQRINFVPAGRLSLSRSTSMTSAPTPMTLAQPLPVESSSMGEDAPTGGRDSDSPNKLYTPDPKNGQPRLGPTRSRPATSPPRGEAARPMPSAPPPQ